jgi:hypothetical protein
MPQRAHLKVYGQGEIEVELVAAYLKDLRHAYDSILVFWPPTLEEVASLVPRSEQLILVGPVIDSAAIL